jgi:6-oxocyclohex-1-ene-carbonyl-CoA hydrolase
LSCTACEPWSAHKALRLGLLTDVVPSLRDASGAWVPNPLVYTDGATDAWGRPRLGEPKTGADLAAGKAALAQCTSDLSALDEAVDALCSKLVMTFPGCTTRTLESLRKHKLAHWDKNREGSRSWLGLNMLAEANAGFRAFNEGTKDQREVDFVALRRRLATGERWSEELIRAVAPVPLKELE